MNKDEARKILENNRKSMQKQKKLNEGAENSLSNSGCDDASISGPQNDIDYRRMLKDIQESANEDKS